MPSIKLEDALLEVDDDEAIKTEVSNLATWGTDDPKLVADRERQLREEFEACYMHDFFDTMDDLREKQTPPGEYDDFEYDESNL